MARCESCNKFVSFGDSEFQVDSEEVTYQSPTSVLVTLDVEMNRPCGDCGTTLRSATFNVEQEVPLPPDAKPITEDDELRIDLDDPEETSRSEGKGRGLKSFYGFSLSGRVTITRAEKEEEEEAEAEATEAPTAEGEEKVAEAPKKPVEEEKELEVEFEVHDDMQASHFDEA